jgi:hypothetical protein
MTPHELDELRAGFAHIDDQGRYVREPAPDAPPALWSQRAARALVSDTRERVRAIAQELEHGSPNQAHVRGWTADAIGHLACLRHILDTWSKGR